MSAKRYSGAIVISLTYVDHDSKVPACSERFPNGFYRCSLSRGVRREWSTAFVVGAPRVLSRPVYSRETFDVTARAALAFAAADDSDWGDAAAYTIDGSGYHVGRAPRNAWPKAPAAPPAPRNPSEGTPRFPMKARGMLRHIFHGTAEAACIVLAFDSAEAAASALAIVGEPFAIAASDPRALIALCTSPEVHTFKETHASRIAINPCGWRHCHPRAKGAIGPCKGRAIDSLTHSVDVGPAFTFDAGAI